jgi:hypothetical protein
MARKVRKLALELRPRTTQPLAWIADRLNMGTRGHLAWLLGREKGGNQSHGNIEQPCLI